MLKQEYNILSAVEQQHLWFKTLQLLVLRQLEQESRSLGRPLCVFDAGCGTGFLLLRVREEPFVSVAEGCELNTVALAYARSRGLRVEEHSVNCLESWPRQYDVVHWIDVSYHQNIDPVRSLRGMAALLSPGGLLLVNVAAMPCLARGHDHRVMGARRFLLAGLRRLCQPNGLAVENLRYWSNWLTPMLWLQRRLIEVLSGSRTAVRRQTAKCSGLLLPPPWLNRMLEGLLQLEMICSTILPLPFGSSLFVRTRKVEHRTDS